MSISSSTYNITRRKKINVHLDPPIPEITTKENGSRWIYVMWKIPEITFISFFEMFLDGNSVEKLNQSSSSINNTTFFYNYTNLQPYRQ